MTELLSCRDIHKSYGGVKVLRGVTLGVNRGEIFGLTGANGAGKSTLIDVITGQTAYTSGEIFIGDVPVSRGGAALRAQLGLARTFQRPQVAAELTLLENIRVARAAAGLSSHNKILSAFIKGFFGGGEEDEAEIRNVCRQLSLREPDRLAAEVTFGELRLLEFARALMLKPKVIVLDEPFSGVGDAGINGIIEALRALRDAGCAVLLVDHNIDLLTPLVDRMALLAQGEILVEGSVETCLHSPVFRSTYIGVA
ncbi:ABC transporter ATP-binding protein [Pseudochelatococcus sp. G4_1912]|uniref:ABC transporter ATP-binding protein n=1 Tax=Pseudochelatococcus sp. G4_1912 TaxID=3114288 RepID=UPI0039C64A87